MDFPKVQLADGQDRTGMRTKNGNELQRNLFHDMVQLMSGRCHNGKEVT